MTFEQTFRQTDVRECIEHGIQALGRDAGLINCANTHGFQGSVNLDRCLAAKYPQDHRWDYAFGFGNRIYYVEVHHVSDSEVKVVIAKYQWLRDWQNCQPNPPELKENSHYHWLSRGRIGLTRNSQFSRKLTQSGLDYPRKVLRIE